MSGLLQDKIFISTRPEGQSEELAQLFLNAGANLLELPLIKIQRTQLREEEKKCILQVNDFHWLVFTSPNGVRYFFENLQELQGSQKLLATIQIAVIGNKTEKVLKSFGYQPSFVNPGSTGEEFAAAFSSLLKSKKHKQKVLLALGKIAREVIQNEINEIAKCSRINLYETLPVETLDEKMWKLISEDKYEMLLFTSPSGINNFVKIAGSINLKNTRMACIGETTAKAAIENNITPKVVAQISTAAGLFESVINYFKNKNL